MEELRRAAKAAAAAQQGDRPQGQQQAAAPRRRHSPVVWGQPKAQPPETSDSPEEGLIESSPQAEPAAADGSSPAAPAAGRPLTAAETAARELAAFQQSLDQEDVDPDAPAAMRASPSVSDDPGEDWLKAYRL